VVKNVAVLRQEFDFDEIRLFFFVLDLEPIHDIGMRIKVDVIVDFSVFVADYGTEKITH
jgi:hypothetical protein